MVQAAEIPWKNIKTMIGCSLRILENVEEAGYESSTNKMLVKEVSA
jgi:hypothetical protein